MVKLSVLLSLLAALSLAGPAAGGERPNGLVILLTDFGDIDHYVGMLKGTVYSVSTDVKVDTITNEVWPFDVPDGAFMLYQAAAVYPPGTTFLAVVDPGSGRDRMPVALRTRDGKYFVGPDNGLLDLVADRLGVDEIRLISNPAFLGKEALSGTFHSYDLFGPAAAHIAIGAPFDEIGPVFAPEKRVSLPEAELLEDGSLAGETLYVDHYGNVVTSIEPKLLDAAGFAQGDSLTIRLGKKKVRAKLSTTYEDVPSGDYVCFIDDSGFLQIAVNEGSLVDRLNLKVKPEITVAPKPAARKRK